MAVDITTTGLNISVKFALLVEHQTTLSQGVNNVQLAQNALVPRQNSQTRFVLSVQTGSGHGHIYHASTVLQIKLDVMVSVVNAHTECSLI